MAVRVSIFGLILGAAIVAVPGLIPNDASAAHAAPVAVISPVATAAAEVVTATVESNSALDPASWDAAELGAVDPKVFELALEAAAKAVQRGDVDAPKTLTVIDFSLPSTQQRLWVYDLRTRELAFEEHVSHGRGSGKALATAFSNVPESNQSSLGLYRTGETYFGKHGYSLRLDGLEAGVNDRARERAIVMHAAEYVNASAAKAQGYLGRSLGCPAVRPEISRELIDTVKGGSLIFAFYPDENWLNGSTYLN